MLRNSPRATATSAWGRRRPLPSPRGGLRDRGGGAAGGRVRRVRPHRPPAHARARAAHGDREGRAAEHAPLPGHARSLQPPARPVERRRGAARWRASSRRGSRTPSSGSGRTPARFALGVLPDRAARPARARGRGPRRDARGALRLRARGALGARVAPRPDRRTRALLELRALAAARSAARAPPLCALRPRPSRARAADRASQSPRAARSARPARGRRDAALAGAPRDAARARAGRRAAPRPHSIGSRCRRPPSTRPCALLDRFQRFHVGVELRTASFLEQFLAPQPRSASRRSEEAVAPLD